MNRYVSAVAALFLLLLSFSTTTAVASDAAALQQARRLIAELRRDLAPVEDQIRNHPYLAALERGEISRDNLRAFAGEEYYIIRSDLASNALLVSRLGANPGGDFFRGLLEGERIALDLIRDFAAALGWDEDDLAAYEPLPGGQAFPAYVTTLALRASEAEVAAAFLLNFAVFGENTGRMSAALKSRYGFTDAEVAFFDFFAAPIPGFEDEALAVIAFGLDHCADPVLIRRDARLLQAYELGFWDAVGSIP